MDLGKIVTQKMKKDFNLDTKSNSKNTFQLLDIMTYFRILIANSNRLLQVEVSTYGQNFATSPPKFLTPIIDSEKKKNKLIVQTNPFIIMKIIR